MTLSRSTLISTAVYALVLAGGAFLLQWLEYNYVKRVFATEFYIAIIALVFVVLGVWIGTRLTPRAPSASFQRNNAALKTLGVTEREVTVLELLASGQSNKEIARSLAVSPNTVKTHVASLFAKLGVQRRTQAIAKARELSLIA